MQLSTKLFVIIGLVLAVAGCAYTTKSDLPQNIKKIEVVTFGNTTYYNQLEGDLTRHIIKAINLSPGLKVVNSGADAVLSGNIYKVANTGMEYDAKYQPKELETVIFADFSLYDNTEGYFIINDRSVASNSDSSTAGKFDPANNETYNNPKEKALASLAQTIVRSMVSKW